MFMSHLKNTILLPAFLLFFLTSFSSVALATSDKVALSSPQQRALALKTIVLFYSKQCPHCSYVLDYIKSNHLDKKYNIIEKEISADQGNHGEFIKTIKACLTANKANKDTVIELPVSWDGNKCFYGEKEVLSYF